MPIRTDQSKSYLLELTRLSKKSLKAIGWESLTVDATAGGVKLASIPANATYALVVVESSITTSAIRYLECGNTVQTVTSSIGIPRSNLDAFDIQSAENLANFRAIQVSAGTHTLSVQYYM